MENITNLFNDAMAYAAMAVAFVSGLIVDFKGYTKNQQIMIVVGGFVALVVVLSVLQAAFS